MTPASQMIMLMAFIGLLIGGIATLSNKGGHLISHLVVGMIGSFVGGIWLPSAIGIVFDDPFVSTLVFSPIGAILFLLGVRVMFRLRSAIWSHTP
jgi:uncharacterized membrane protein YeaQ/YmgE (transglycosylase-associated protein family)